MCNGGDNHDNKDARLRPGPDSHEDGGLAENTGDGSTGALCYCDPDPLSAIGNGGDNYNNNDVRSLAELGRDYNGMINAIEEELCAVEGLDGLQAQARKGRST